MASYRWQIAALGVGAAKLRKRAERSQVPKSRQLRHTKVLLFEGIVMSGWRPLIKGYFAAVRLIVGAVMSSACRCGS